MIMGNKRPVSTSDTYIYLLYIVMGRGAIAYYMIRAG